MPCYLLAALGRRSDRRCDHTGGWVSRQPTRGLQRGAIHPAKKRARTWGLVIALALVPVLSIHATELTTAVAQVRLTDDWILAKDGPTEVVFVTTSGQQQLAVRRQTLTTSPNPKELGHAALEALRRTIASHQRLNGNALVFDEFPMTTIRAGVAVAATGGYDSRSGHRLALRLEVRRDQHRTTVVYDCTGLDLVEFRHWSERILDAVR